MLLSACAPTTIDETLTRSSEAATTTTVPRGSAAELVQRMADDAAALSDLIGSRGRKTEQLALITAKWDVARPQIDPAQEVLVENLDAAVALCTIAVERNRPADADKCFRNLSTMAGDLQQGGG